MGSLASTSTSIPSSSASSASGTYEKRNRTFRIYPEESTIDQSGQLGKIPFKEFRGLGHPKDEIGASGDTYIDITPGMHELYAKYTDNWKKWPGPSHWKKQSKLLSHPIYSNLYLWCNMNSNTVGWVPFKKVHKLLFSSASEILSTIITAQSNSRRRAKERMQAFENSRQNKKRKSTNVPTAFPPTEDKAWSLTENLHFPSIPHGLEMKAGRSTNKPSYPPISTHHEHEISPHPFDIPEDVAPSSGLSYQPSPSAPESSTTHKRRKLDLGPVEQMDASWHSLRSKKTQINSTNLPNSTFIPSLSPTKKSIETGGSMTPSSSDMYPPVNLMKGTLLPSIYPSSNLGPLTPALIPKTPKKSLSLPPASVPSTSQSSYFVSPVQHVDATDLVTSPRNTDNIIDPSPRISTYEEFFNINSVTSSNQHAEQKTPHPVTIRSSDEAPPEPSNPPLSVDTTASPNRLGTPFSPRRRQSPLIPPVIPSLSTIITGLLEKLERVQHENLILREHILKSGPLPEGLSVEDTTPARSTGEPHSMDSNPAVEDPASSPSAENSHRDRLFFEGPETPTHQSLPPPTPVPPVEQPTSSPAGNLRRDRLFSEGTETPSHHSPSPSSPPLEASAYPSPTSALPAGPPSPRPPPERASSPPNDRGSGGSDLPMQTDTVAVKEEAIGLTLAFIPHAPLHGTAHDPDIIDLTIDSDNDEGGDETKDIEMDTNNVIQVTDDKIIDDEHHSQSDDRNTQSLSIHPNTDFDTPMDENVEEPPPTDTKTDEPQVNDTDAALEREHTHKPETPEPQDVEMTTTDSMKSPHPTVAAAPEILPPADHSSIQESPTPDDIIVGQPNSQPTDPVSQIAPTITGADVKVKEEAAIDISIGFVDNTSHYPLKQCHIDILYHTVGLEKICRMCLQNKPMRIFKLKSDCTLEVLAKHCSKKHGEVCEGLVGMNSEELNDIRRQIDGCVV